MFRATDSLIANRNGFKGPPGSIGQHLGCEVLTKRALGEAPGSPRETESGRSLADRSDRLLGKDPGGEGTDSAGDGGHFEVWTKGIESVGKKWEEGRV